MHSQIRVVGRLYEDADKLSGYAEEVRGGRITRVKEGRL